MLSTTFFYLSFTFYGGALLSYFFLLASGTERIRSAPIIFMAAGFSLHTLGIALRTHEFQHLPLANLFEYLFATAWFTALAYFVIIKFVRNRFAGACAVTAVIMLMLIVSLLPKEGTTALMPALRSCWLYIHVTAAAASEGLFAIGCAASMLFILKSTLPSTSGLASKIPGKALLDTLAYRTIVIGYLLFTLGALFAGAVWAHRAWGSFWSWDPKETCSLIVWIIYSSYLYVRAAGNMHGLLPHFLSVAGFTAALLTFFSSMFLGGLHSYG